MKKILSSLLATVFLAMPVMAEPLSPTLLEFRSKLETIRNDIHKDTQSMVVSGRKLTPQDLQYLNNPDTLAVALDQTTDTISMMELNLDVLIYVMGGAMLHPEILKDFDLSVFKKENK